MLALTEDAASAIGGILSANELPETAGLRITAESTAEDSDTPSPNLRLTVVEGPNESDEVLEEAPVYLEPQAADLLDDKILDANQVGGEVEFRLQQQA